MDFVKAPHSSAVMPRKNIAMAKADIWLSVTSFFSKPVTMKLISSVVRIFPSRLR